MEKFSVSLNEATEDLTELDLLIDNRGDITNEEELLNFSSSLPDKWSKYKSKVEVFIRHRDAIGYEEMDISRAIICYSAIKNHMKKSQQRMFEKYFDTETTDFNMIKLTRILHEVGIKHPEKGIHVMSLLNYMLISTAFEDEENTSSPLQIEMVV